VRVRFFAYLRDYTGCAEADVPYKETVGALARSLCDLYGSKLGQKIFPPCGSGREGEPGMDKFGPEIIILINGRHVNHLDGFNSALNPDDRVDFFPVVAGG
jgi:molybdopterin synthase sulfur carrier subunit